MASDFLIIQAQQVWLELAGVPATFPTEGTEVVVSERSLLCPPGWSGIVTLGNAAIITVPEHGIAELVRQRLGGLPVAALTDPDLVRRALPVAELLGPATLAYCDEYCFQPPGPETIDVIPAGHADLATFLASVPPDDADECGLAEITSAAFVVRTGTHVVAAAGYRHWPGQAAHICVLTAPRQRGRGLARVVAGAAVARTTSTEAQHNGGPGYELNCAATVGPYLGHARSRYAEPGPPCSPLPPFSEGSEANGRRSVAGSRGVCGGSREPVHRRHQP